MHKYDGAEMKDPLVRCDNCAKLVLVAFIQRHAGCNSCGNKRFNFTHSITSEEKTALEKQEYDLGVVEYEIPPDYLDIFRAVES